MRSHLLETTSTSCAARSTGPWDHPCRSLRGPVLELVCSKGMSRLVALALTLGGSWLSSTRAAEPQVVQEPDKTLYKKKTVIDFNDVTLEGELTRPEGSYVINRKKTKFGSLVKLRRDFLPELQRSVDNL